jgi:hypothetical protein
MRQRKPRVIDNAYLRRIRTLPCVVCGRGDSTEAAHIRFGRDGEGPTGLGRRSDDKRALPLCSHHHREQHSQGERRYWSMVGLDPHAIAEKLHKAFQTGDINDMVSVLNEARNV